LETSANDCGTLSPKNVSNSKRKMSDVEQKIDSKCGKVGSTIASVAKAVSAKRIKAMSLNFNKITAEQNFEKGNADDDRLGMCLDCFAKIPSP
jgi:topoisomerase (DNA) II binding protein 1